MSLLNIAAYKFITLTDLPVLQEQMLHAASAAQLKGTVLLASEGINLFLAGPTDALRGFLAGLREDPRFADLEPKESWSAHPPFRKMLVKIKPEIIRMNNPAIRPEQGRAPAVSAHTLRRWLDQGSDDSGQPVLLLDTRNDFEVQAGTFEGAVDWGIAQFTDFPAALNTHAAQLQGHAVVSFCTGGIRCEKAALLMREAGVASVYQLEGGILKYFETEGRTHYRGECFVFDARRGLDPALQPRMDAALAAVQPARTPKSSPKLLSNV